MTYDEMADHIATLLTERLGIRRRGLARKLARAGRLLPRDIRRDAQVLLQATQFQASPRLSRMIEQARVQSAYENCETYLMGIDPSARRKHMALNLLTTNSINILAVMALVVSVLVWRGFL